MSNEPQTDALTPLPTIIETPKLPTLPVLLPEELAANPPSVSLTEAPNISETTLTAPDNLGDVFTTTTETFPPPRDPAELTQKIVESCPKLKEALGLTDWPEDWEATRNATTTLVQRDGATEEGALVDFSRLVVDAEEQGVTQNELQPFLVLASLTPDKKPSDVLKTYIELTEPTET